MPPPVATTSHKLRMPQMSFALKNSEAYRRYVAGMPDDNGNTKGRRWTDLDPFEHDVGNEYWTFLAITNVYTVQDDDCIQLPLGEVFCRMLMADDSLCCNVRVVRVTDYRWIY